MLAALCLYYLYPSAETAAPADGGRSLSPARCMLVWILLRQ